MTERPTGVTWTPRESVEERRAAERLVREYDAFRTRALCLDRQSRGRMTFEGPKTREVLSGLVTSDVESLTPGHGQYGAALTPKGKIVADLRIFARADDFLVDVAPRAMAAWEALLRKYVNPRLARYVNVSDAMGCAGVFGARAAEVVGRAAGLPVAELAALAEYAHLSGTVSGVPVMVARSPEAGLPGFELFAPSEQAAAVRSALEAAGAMAGSDTTWTVIRIEAGRPEYGVDIDEQTLPQEGNLDELRAISYTKGCYTGQETVARVHFRGHVNRHLRGLRFASAPGMAGAALTDVEGKVVGDVRSVAWSPRLGDIGLGMVRREVPPGGELGMEGVRGRSGVEVIALPFPLD
jgi:tRNA-modifying protein YgfZ